MNNSQRGHDRTVTAKCDKGLTFAFCAGINRWTFSQFTKRWHWSSKAGLLQPSPKVELLITKKLDLFSSKSLTFVSPAFFHSAVNFGAYAYCLAPPPALPLSDDNEQGRTINSQQSPTTLPISPQHEESDFGRHWSCYSPT